MSFSTNNNMGAPEINSGDIREVETIYRYYQHGEDANFEVLIIVTAQIMVF
jgi:hypothetical protein